MEFGQKSATMKSFRVKGISVYFSTEPSREFTIRYFTVMYILHGGKIISRNYYHTEKNITTILQVPSSLEMDEDFVNSVPFGIPTPYLGEMRLSVPNMLTNELLTVIN